MSSSNNCVMWPSGYNIIPNSRSAKSGVGVHFISQLIYNSGCSDLHDIMESVAVFEGIETAMELSRSHLLVGECYRPLGHSIRDFYDQLP